MSVSISGGSILDTLPPINSTSWNEVASAVGCGTSALFILFSDSPRLTALKAPDDEQLICMKKVPGRALEDAVVSMNGNFGLVKDSS